MTVGILGGGQLARMLALAGHAMGLEMRALDPSGDACVGDVCALVVGGYDDPDALSRFLDGLDVVTCEFERVPMLTLEQVSGVVAVLPGASSFRVCRDRLLEKQVFADAGIPVAAYEAVDTIEDLRRAMERIGTPAILKTRTEGYDGRGQAIVREVSGADEAWASIGHRPALCERLVAFDREVSVVGVRDRAGRTAFYPVTENRHAAGILFTSVAPSAGVSGAVQALGERHAAGVMDRLGHVGVFTVEFFEVGGELLGNEAAPRVHNSGHWTIEGARTSQFENHMRAIAGWALGSTAAHGHAGMVNLVGQMPDRGALLAVPGVSVHDYRKAARPGRKVGHCTITGDSAEVVRASMDRVLTLVPPPTSARPIDEEGSA